MENEINDERLVCRVEPTLLRFGYAHHPDQTWEVGIVADLVDRATGKATWTLVERALTEEEAGALLDTHLAAVFRPREFTLDTTTGVVAMVVWLAAGFGLGIFVYGFVASLVL